MIFNNYAKYYDLLYQDKDYKKEIDYIDLLIKSNINKKSIKILDIGCGTGMHAKYLSEKGYHVTGIDLSSEMIQIANERKTPNTAFYVKNATDFEIDGKFDVILSLFHVVSYQTTNQNIYDMFSGVAKHLDDNGVFIFDFWYGSAVLSELPSVRVKRLEDDQIKVFRLAEPDIYFNRNIVDVKYELIIYNKETNQTEIFNESHKMRYLFLPEVDSYLNQHDMGAMKYEEWLTSKEPSTKTWGVTCIAKKAQ